MKISQLSLCFFALSLLCVGCATIPVYAQDQGGDAQTGDPAPPPSSGSEAPADGSSAPCTAVVDVESSLPPAQRSTPWEQPRATSDVFFASNVTNCTQCSLPTVSSFGPIQVCNPSLIGSWLIAVAVGLCGGWSLFSIKGRFRGGASYGVSFTTYAIMITSGFVVHSVFLVECGVPIDDARLKLYVVVTLIDGILTSCIAVSFFFNALVDLKWLDERGCKCVFLMLGSYAAIAAGYLAGVSFVIMYIAVIAFGCGSYLILQLVRMYVQDDARAIAWFIITGVAGAISFAPVAIPTIGCFLCETFGGWIVEAYWYYGADITMAILLKYVVETRQPYHNTENVSYEMVQSNY